MTRFFRHPWGWTSLAPLLCTIHCIATPIALVAAPQLVPGAGAEWALLGITVVLAGVIFMTGMRAHGELLPFLLAGVGLLAWSGSLLHLFDPVPETLGKALASGVVATGFIWNSRLHCAANEGDCAVCEAGDGQPEVEPLPLPDGRRPEIAEENPDITAEAS